MNRLARRIGFALRTLWLFFTIWFLIIHFTPVEGKYAGWLSGNWTQSDGEVLIVLSNDTEPGNIIGLGSYWRAVYALLAWRDGHFHDVVVSGGWQNGVDKPAAEVIADFLVAGGIPRERIFTETRSASTRENALFTTRMIAAWPGRKVLLTSDYHMFRARRAFEIAGLHVIPRPFPDVIKESGVFMMREYCFGVLAGETAKIAYYWQKGWI